MTRERIAAYLDELRRQEVAPYTLRNRIRELLAVMLALAPDRNWSWLKACVVHLDRRAEDAADRSLPPLLASDVIDRGMKELRRRAAGACVLARGHRVSQLADADDPGRPAAEAPQFRGALASTAHESAGRHLVDRY